MPPSLSAAAYSIAIASVWLIKFSSLLIASYSVSKKWGSDVGKVTYNILLILLLYSGDCA